MLLPAKISTNSSSLFAFNTKTLQNLTTTGPTTKIQQRKLNKYNHSRQLSYIKSTMTVVANQISLTLIKIRFEHHHNNVEGIRNKITEYSLSTHSISNLANAISMPNVFCKEYSAL